MTREPSPGISDVLLADLRDLESDLGAGALGETSLLVSGLSSLRHDLELAVPSLVGFSVTMTVPGPVVSVRVDVVDEVVDTSTTADQLVVHLQPHQPGITTSLTCYAADRDAFDDLRAELVEALDVTATTTPDPPRVLVPGITGLEALRDVHRALGVLLAAGHTSTSATNELVRRAHDTPGGLSGAARALLHPAARPSPRSPGA